MIMKNSDKVRTYTKADNGKLLKGVEFSSGGKVEITINKDGSVKWYDDNRLLKKGKQGEQA